MSLYERMLAIPGEIWLVFGQMAPYLLFGFLVAGILSVWLPESWVERRLAGRGLRPVFLASILGIPLPLCSCSVIPVSAALRRYGASRGATTAFFLSTPQTGVDSIAVTYSLLGPLFAVFRPLLALITGVIGGALVDRFDHEEPEPEKDLSTEDEPGEKSMATEGDNEPGSCCHAEPEGGPFRRIIHFALVDLPRSLAAPLLIGVIIAGAISAMVPVDVLEPYLGGGLLPMFVMMAVGAPLYVCATASVPLAVGFIHAGVSPGAALVFLIVGPATNAATLAALWKVLGRRAALIYFLVVVISAVLAGLAFDQLIDWTGTTVGMAHADHGEAVSGWNNVWAVLMLVVLLYSLMTRYFHRKKAMPCCREENHSCH